MHDQSLPTTPTTAWRRVGYILLALAALPVVGVLIWQGVTSHGNPDPTVPNTSHFSAILDTSVLVFREGLESILVLAAITAGVSRQQEGRAQPIFLGAGTGFFATLVTWFFVRGIIQDISVDISYLALQALTGLVAVVVLLIVMSVYREGFEVVLFLQSYYLKLGGWTVLYGSLIGLGLTLIVAVLTFVAHRRMPYRKMLIFTGVMLGFVLLVMVGEEIYEMQQANWLGTTNIPALAPYMPDWAGVWFSLFPNWETIIAQAVAALLVVGSYFISGKVMASHPAAEQA